MSKGSQWEREFCRMLSLWWSEGICPELKIRDDIFWRTSNSGGRATSRTKKGQFTKNQYGDVMAVDPIGQPLLDLITIEVKRGYSQHTIYDLLDKSEGAAVQVWEKWYKKILEDSKQAGTPYWMLVQRRDRRLPVAFLPWEFFKDLRSVGDWGLPSSELIFYWEGRKIYAASLSYFFSYTKPSQISNTNNLRTKS